MGVLLVHGAWHGAWCWAPVLDEFRSGGVEALAVDLPGHGSRRSFGSALRLDDYVSAVVQAAAKMSKPPLLVGHSMGGMVISAAAERDPSAFRSLTYLAAFLPGSGQALADLTAELGSGQGRVEGENVVLERDEAHRLFYQDCDASLAAWALDQLHPEPLAPAFDQVALTEERFGRLARDYVVCARDQAIDPGFQRRMAARGLCQTVVEFDCGHSPFLACASKLTDHLIALGGAD